MRQANSAKLVDGKVSKVSNLSVCLCKNRIMTDSLVPWVGVAVGVGVHETRAEGERGWMDGWMDGTSKCG